MLYLFWDITKNGEKTQRLLMIFNLKRGLINEYQAGAVHSDDRQ
jgi:hypothetical protein